jgi:hypothetical protein
LQHNTLVEGRLPVHPWWRTEEKGQVVFFVRLGWKPIEFEKGKAGVVAGSMDKLPEVIDVLIGAVRAGELEPVLEQARAVRCQSPPVHTASSRAFQFGVGPTLAQIESNGMPWRRSPPNWRMANSHFSAVALAFCPGNPIPGS